MKLTNLIAVGLTATLLGTGVSNAQTAPTTPAEVQVVVKDQAAAQMPEVIALVDELKAQGFTTIEIRSTLLGRAKIMAYNADSLREIVLSSTTGEIMRDVVRANEGSKVAGTAALQAAQNGLASTAGAVAGGIAAGMTGGMSGN